MIKRNGSREFWSVPPMWQGRTVTLLGGGPGLTPAIVAAANRIGPLVAINDAYRLAPNADAHYFCDERWHRWHTGRPGYADITGLRLTLENLHLRAEIEELCCIQNLPGEGLSALPWAVYAGRSSGYQCLQIAIHAGAARVLLAGFDMRAVDGRTHWHEGHPQPTAAHDYHLSLVPPWKGVAEAAAARGVEVICVTPGSALGAYLPIRPIEEFLPCPLPTPTARALSAS